MMNLFEIYLLAVGRIWIDIYDVRTWRVEFRFYPSFRKCKSVVSIQYLVP
jgi:hypothetical protein